jgi:hypothetical protein
MPFIHILVFVHTPQVTAVFCYTNTTRFLPNCNKTAQVLTLITFTTSVTCYNSNTVLGLTSDWLLHERAEDSAVPERALNVELKSVVLRLAVWAPTKGESVLVHGVERSGVIALLNGGSMVSLQLWPIYPWKGLQAPIE